MRHFNRFISNLLHGMLYLWLINIKTVLNKYSFLSASTLMKLTYASFCVYHLIGAAYLAEHIEINQFRPSNLRFKPDLSATSQLLYRLSYHGSLTVCKQQKHKNIFTSHP